MERMNLRGLVVLTAVTAAAGAIVFAAPPAQADHIPDPDYVHAPLQYAGKFVVHRAGTSTGDFWNRDGHVDVTMAVDTDRVFVVYGDREVVGIFDLSGNPLGHFDHPSRWGLGYGAIVLNNFNVFVTDEGRNQVVIFDLSGNHLGSFGSFGTDSGQFQSIHSLALSPTRLFVTDAENNRVQTFGLFGGAGAFGGNILIPNGTGLGHVRGEAHVATNATHIFVGDAHNRIQIFDASGNYTGAFGSAGDRSGQFYHITDIVANSTHLFVADSGNNRIQMFDMAGNYAGEFDSYGTGPDRFVRITDLALNSTHLFVVDSRDPDGYDNARIQLFKLAGGGTVP